MARDFCNLVDQQCSSISCFDRSTQLGFEQFRRYRVTVDMNEWSRSTMALRMKSGCYQLFARATFALYQDWCIRGRSVPDRLENLLQLDVPTYHAECFRSAVCGSCRSHESVNRNASCKCCTQCLFSIHCGSTSFESGNLHNHCALFPKEVPTWG